MRQNVRSSWVWGAALALSLLCVGGSAQAQSVEVYTVDPVHSSVSFRIRHLVSYVTGHFRDFSGTIHIDREDLTRSSVELVIRTASIDTANERRDNHLRSEEFFDVAKYPEMRFRSTKIEKVSETRYHVTGKFFLHGVEQEITVPVELLGFTSHERFGERAGFHAELTLDRTAYGITWNMPGGAGSLVLGEEVRVAIDLEAAKQAAPTGGDAPAAGNR